MTGIRARVMSAADEAATVDVLCSDKTGTLTLNELTVAAIRPEPGFDEAHVLAMAALASSNGGQDPVDTAIRSAASAIRHGRCVGVWHRIRPELRKQRAGRVARQLTQAPA